MSNERDTKPEVKTNTEKPDDKGDAALTDDQLAKVVGSGPATVQPQSMGKFPEKGTQ